MKYSLRSLFLAVTLIAVLLGGRVEYLRRIAGYHSTEYRRLIQSLAAEHDMSEERVEELLRTLEEYPGERTIFASVSWGTTNNGTKKNIPIATAIKHKRLARVYRQSCYQPWALVDEGTP